MQNDKRQRVWTAALVAGLCGSIGATGYGLYQQEALAGHPADAAAVQPISALRPALPAKPTLTSAQAWAMVGPEVQMSPWLSRADETSAWIDGAGQDAQDAAAVVAGHLRELSVLMNEQWAGRQVTRGLKAAADGTAALSPEPSLRALALGVSYAVDHADEWAVMLANRTEELSRWVESFTEPYERYARAYAALTEQPSAERVVEWVAASQALLPHLAQAERVCAALEAQLAGVSECLHSVHGALAGADHWSVDWLASRIDGQLIVPSVEKLDRLNTQVGAIKARAMYDHALIASLPGRLARYEIVD